MQLKLQNFVISRQIFIGFDSHKVYFGLRLGKVTRQILVFTRFLPGTVFETEAGCNLWFFNVKHDYFSLI